MKHTCDCDRKARYEDCCGRFHQGEEPGDPLTLMRSRYTAFVRNDGAYLWKTLHPDHDDREREEAEFIRSMSGRTGVHFAGLTVLDSAEPDEDGCAQLLYLVKATANGKDESFVEQAFFLQDDGAWRYLTGTVASAKSMHGHISHLNLANFEAHL